MKQQDKFRLNTLYGKRNMGTLDAAVCEWCTDNTPATNRTVLTQGHTIHANLCNRHAQEAASDFTKINLYTLNPEPRDAYQILENTPSEMREFTVAQLELGERYGVPYPVCGDTTALRRYPARELSKRIYAAIRAGKISWTGHDPNGTQY